MKKQDLEDHLGYWLRFVSNHVSGSFREGLAEYDVTVAEWVALRTIAMHAPCTLNTVSEQIGVDNGATSRLVDKLNKKKLVSRKTGAKDRRAITLELSESGKKLLPKLIHLADKNDEAFFGSLTKVDKEHLKRIMKTLIEANKLTEKPIN